MSYNSACLTIQVAAAATAQYMIRHIAHMFVFLNYRLLILNKVCVHNSHIYSVLSNGRQGGRWEESYVTDVNILHKQQVDFKMYTVQRIRVAHNNIFMNAFPNTVRTHVMFIIKDVFFCIVFSFPLYFFSLY